MPDSMEMHAQQLVVGCVVITIESSYCKATKSAEKGCSIEDGAHRALAICHICSYDNQSWHWRLAIHEFLNFHPKSNGF